jgi:ferredoxin--NADP+ reductase
MSAIDKPDIEVPASRVPGTQTKWTEERVLSMHYWTPTVVTFRVTRFSGFRFAPGHYTRLGLGADDNVVWRPFSMASAADDEFLDFIAVLVPGGAFSEHLRQLRVGDYLRVDKASFGFLTVDQLARGKDLWMLASGTGLGPFRSILRDPAVWQDFEHLILAHSVRQSDELVWRNEFAELQQQNGVPTDLATLTYIPIVTREPAATQLSERIPKLVEDGRLEIAADCQLEVATSRVLVCGNPEMTRTMRQILSARGFAPNRRGAPGQIAFEKYW